MTSELNWLWKTQVMNVSCICVSDLFLALFIHIVGASQVVLVVKNPPAHAGDIKDVGLIPESGRFPGGGNNSLQYSCLDNPMDRGPWQATFMGSQRVGHDWLNTCIGKSWLCHAETRAVELPWLDIPLKLQERSKSAPSSKPHDCFSKETLVQCWEKTIILTMKGHYTLKKKRHEKWWNMVHVCCCTE